MLSNLNLEYYYGDEVAQFSLCLVPKGTVKSYAHIANRIPCRQIS